MSSCESAHGHGARCVTNPRTLAGTASEDLEKIAELRRRLASGRDAIAARRPAELGTEAANEVGQIREADIERNVGDLCPGHGRARPGAAQPRAGACAASIDAA